MASLRIRPTLTCAAVTLHPAARNACCVVSCHIGKALTFFMLMACGERQQVRKLLRLQFAGSPGKEVDDEFPARLTWRTPGRMGREAAIKGGATNYERTGAPGARSWSAWRRSMAGTAFHSLMARISGWPGFVPRMLSDAVSSEKCAPSETGKPIQRVARTPANSPWENRATFPVKAFRRRIRRSARSEIAPGISPPGQPSTKALHPGRSTRMSRDSLPS